MVYFICAKEDFRRKQKFAISEFVICFTVYVYDRVENIVGKGENAGYQHFLLFPQCFQKVFFLRVVKSRDCAVKSWCYYLNLI